MTTTTIRSVHAFEQTLVDDENALFHCDVLDRRFVLIVPREDWEAFGSPLALGVEIEPA